jgi:hypothetical protein
MPAFDPVIVSQVPAEASGQLGNLSRLLIQQETPLWAFGELVDD